MAAKIAPDILCQTEKTAPGTVAMARSGKALAARLVASPEFCIPISIDRARVFAEPDFIVFPIMKPHR